MSIAMPRATQAPLETSDAAQDDTPATSHEAARFAVLRRIGSAIRHQIAGSLQPMTMMASLLERRLQADAPNLDALRRNAMEMNGLSRSASSECVALMSWIVPHDGDVVAVDQGVEDCVHLLVTELSFRGFSVINATQGHDGRVARQTVRTLVPAALLALTDRATQQASVTLSARSSPERVTLLLTVTPLEGAPPPGRPNGYRALTWQDVLALAQDEGAAARYRDNVVELDLERQDREKSDQAKARWG